MTSRLLPSRIPSLIQRAISNPYGAKGRALDRHRSCKTGRRLKAEYFGTLDKFASPRGLYTFTKM